MCWMDLNPWLAVRFDYFDPKTNLKWNNGWDSGELFFLSFLLTADDEETKMQREDKWEKSKMSTSKGELESEGRQ